MRASINVVLLSIIISLVIFSNCLLVSFSESGDAKEIPFSDKESDKKILIDTPIPVCAPIKDSGTDIFDKHKFQEIPKNKDPYVEISNINTPVSTTLCDVPSLLSADSDISYPLTRYNTSFIPEPSPVLNCMQTEQESESSEAKPVILESTVLYSEDFNENGTLPSGWSTFSEGPDNLPWGMVHEAGDDYRAECNSDTAGPGTDITEWLLMTESVNCSGYVNPQLQFYLNYSKYDGNEFAQLLFSTSFDYPNFTVAEQWDVMTVNGLQTVNIYGDESDTEFYFAFRYHGTYDYWMQIDDIQLIGYVIIDDAYEENDSIFTAYDISDKNQTWLSGINGCGIQNDEDWYKIYMEPGHQQLDVNVIFTNSTGDINVEVYNETGGFVIGSYSTLDDEFIDCLLPTDGIYYLKVFHSDVGNTYDLWWDSVNISNLRASWTVVIYLDCDNNLDLYWKSIPSALKLTGSNTEIRILILYDSNSYGDTEAFQVLPNYLDSIPLNEINSSWTSEVNMGDPNTLISFTEYCIETHPADHYMIIPQDHGGAWLGCCWDDTDGGDYLNISELGWAFSEIESQIGHNVDIAFFNACLMSNIEVASQISSSVDYLVSSETVSWTNTWSSTDYNILINQVKEFPDISPESLSNIIVQEGTPVDDSTHVTQSISALNLTRIPAIQTDVDNLTKELINNFDLYLMHIRNSRLLSEDFEGPYGGQYGRMIDLYDFVSNLNVLVPDANIHEITGRILDSFGPPGGSLGAAIIKQRKTEATVFCNGISVYFPSKPSLYQNNYLEANNFCMNTQWDEFLQVYYASPTEDNYEENDNISSALNITGWNNTWLNSLDGFGFQADDDWYRFDIAQNYEMLHFDLQFIQAAGDIDVEIYDASETLIAGYYGDYDNESINRPLPSEGTYFIRIFGAGTGTLYNLMWFGTWVPAANASATGPVFTTPNQINTIYISYTWVGYPLSVNLYFSKDDGLTWSFAGNDLTVDGYYNYSITTGSGVYSWIASAIGGRSAEPLPPPNGTAAEAGPYCFDGDFPVFFSTTFSNGNQTVPTSAGLYEVDFSEEMNAAGYVVTDLQVTEALWIDTDTYRLSYSSLNTDCVYTMKFIDFTDIAGNALGISNVRWFKTVGANATVIGPIGGPINSVEINISYEYIGTPVSVNLYCTNNSGATWSFLGTDLTVDGHYDAFMTGLSGTYGWFASAVGGNSVEQSPMNGTAPEAWPFVLDYISPEISSLTYPDGAVNISTAIGNYDIQFNENMKNTGSISTDIPVIMMYWLNSRTYRVSYSLLAPLTTYGLTLLGFKDVAGNPLDSAVFNTFQTMNVSATALGPIGKATNQREITILYDFIGTPSSVDLYYTCDGGVSWAHAGNDVTVDGTYGYTISTGSGCYEWIACAEGGSTLEHNPPAEGTAPEAGPYIYDEKLPDLIFVGLPEKTAQPRFAVQTAASDANGVAFVTLFIRRDGSLWQNISSIAGENCTWLFDSLNMGGDGCYGFFAVACDNAGNVMTEPTATTDPQSSVIVDSLPPVVSIICPAEGLVLSPGLNEITWVGMDSGSGISEYLFQLDGGEWVSLGVNASVFCNLSAGIHTLKVKAYDGCGSYSESVITFTVNSAPISPAEAHDAFMTWESLALLISAAGALLAYLGYLVFRQRR